MINIFQNTNKAKVTKSFIGKLLLIALLFFIQLKAPQFSEKKWVISLMNGIWTILIPSIIVSVIRYILITVYNSHHTGKQVRGNFVLGINRLTVILNVTFFIVAIMVVLGINPIKFIKGLTIVAMAVAVTFREYITNMLSGLFIMFSDQLSIDDYIQIENTKGRIQDITFSSLVLKNDDNDIITVPNNMVFTHPLINFSSNRPNHFTVRFELPLSIAKYNGKLESILYKIIDTHPDLSSNNKSILQVEEIGRDYVKYKIELFANSSNSKVHQQIENQVLKKIMAFNGEQHA
jgi:small-conductance mechanosensitive channel